jgi:hypothetical protein
MKKLYTLVINTCRNMISTGLALSQLGPVLELSKYIQQHTACFREWHWAPHLLRPALDIITGTKCTM